MTMDSDSASQDSDDGRRFRFEATRKDSNARIDVRGRKSPSSASASRRRQQQQETSRRSNSRDRKNRERRENSRSRQDHRSKRRESRDSASREAARQHTRDNEKAHRGASPKFHRRESRVYERRNSHDRAGSDKKSYPEKSDKFHDRKRFDRERSRDRGSKASPDKLAEDSSSRKKYGRNDDAEKKSHEAEARRVKKRESPTSNDRRSSLNSKNFKLADFDAISDEEDDSSKASAPTREVFRDGTHSRIPQCTKSSENEDELKRRVSKQHYERLMKRQATKKRRSNDELDFTKEIDGREDVGVKSTDDERMEIPSASTSLSTKAFDSAVDKDADIDISSDRITISEIYDSDFDDSRSDEVASGLPPDTGDELPSRSCRAEISRAAKVEGKIDEPRRIVGPFMPENFRAILNDDDADEEENDYDIFGPALPPHLTARKSPAEEENRLADDDKTVEDEKIHGESDDEDFMGPLPVDHPAMENDVVQRRLEMRARRLKAELAACDNEEDNKREEWMIELPPAKSANLGLGPRKFRLRPAPDMSDRSSWTDTPADRARKQMEKSENRNSNEPTVSAVKYKDDAGIEREKSRKREKSLLEMHRKKMQKKKKREEKEAKKNGNIVERRPFDRDIDLQANRFDEARKKSMFLSARKLDDRFSRGQI